MNSRIPPELILNVFDWLKSQDLFACSAVSKRFRDIVFMSKRTFIVTSKTRQVVSRFARSDLIVIEDNERICKESLTNIMKLKVGAQSSSLKRLNSMSNLSRLEITGESNILGSISISISGLLHLKKIILKTHTLDVSTITNCPSLETLIVEDIRDPKYSGNLELMTNLKSLVLCNATGKHSVSIPPIESVKINLMRACCNCGTICRSKKLKNVTNLIVRGSAQYVHGNFNRLVELRMDRPFFFAFDYSKLQLSKQLRKLCLKNASCYDISFLTNLKHLELFDVHIGIVPESLETISVFHGSIASFENLTSLTSLEYRAADITLDVLTSLKNLKTLILCERSSRNISEKDLPNLISFSVKASVSKLAVQIF